MIGHMFVIVAGLAWVAAACLLAEVGRLLSPRFNNTQSVHPRWRFVAWLGAFGMLMRGLTLMYPGKLIEVSRISIMAPCGGLIVLGVTAALLHWVQADRSPPPWSVHFLRLVALLGRDGPVKFAAMAVPPAAIGDAPPVDEAHGERRSRLLVMVGALIVLVLIAAFLAFNSPGAAA